jgi:type IV secretion system protein VirB5
MKLMLKMIIKNMLKINIKAKLKKMMKKIRLSLSTLILVLIFTLSLLVLPISASADDISDILNVLNQIYQVQNHNLPTLPTINTTLVSSLQGSFGYGSLLNTQNDLNQMLWSNNNWQDVLNNVGSGNAAQFSIAQKAYANLYPILSSNQIGQSLTNNDLTRIQYGQQSAISRAGLAASQYSYDQINQHIQNIHNILAMLDNQPSEKAAIDLNTRLVAEISFIQLEELKQQDIQTQILATNSQGDVNSISDSAKFNQWNPTQ